VQIKSAIVIFEAAHLGCQALFIFYQSSAHALLPPDALKAFEMNKSNGRKQWKQCDTVIAQSNPDVSLLLTRFRLHFPYSVSLFCSCSL